MSTQILGVNIGDTIINFRSIDDTDKTLLEERYSTIPATEGVYDAIRKLNEKKFHGNIFLISKCTPWAEEKILAWLNDNDFYKRTGIMPNNVLFCHERHEKEKICRSNKITHYIDNRLEVLSYLVGTVPNLFLYQPDQKELDSYKE